MFGLDGANYEIDLSAKNAAKLRDALAKYVGVARRTSSRARRSGGRGRSSGGNAAAVREWARGNGYEVSDRGRVPASARLGEIEIGGVQVLERRRCRRTVERARNRAHPRLDR